MNLTHIYSSVIIFQLGVLSAMGQTITENYQEEIYTDREYQTEDIYAAEDYHENNPDDYWHTERQSYLEECEDVIIYGNENNANYFRILNEGKERFIYFDEVLVTTRNGELDAVYYPMLWKDGLDYQIVVHISTSFFNPNEYICTPQQSGFSDVARDCIDFFPDQVLNEDAFSHMEVLHTEKDKEGKYTHVSFRYYFTGENDFGDEISLQGVVNTSNIVDLSAPYQASTKNVQGEEIADETHYLFYAEENRSAVLLTIGRFYGGKFSVLPSADNQQLSSTNELTLIEKFHPEYIELHCYQAELADFNENRIFDVANEQQFVNPVLEKTISASNPQPIRWLKAFHLSSYREDGQPLLGNQSLQLAQIEPGERANISPLQSDNNTYCPAPLEGFCIEEVIQSNGQTAQLLITSEYSEEKSILDDLLDDILLAQLHYPVKYAEYFQREDMAAIERGMSSDFDTLLMQYGIPFQTKGEFYNQLQDARGSLEGVALLTSYFGYNQVRQSAGKMEGNNQRYAALVREWSDRFEITGFYRDYTTIFNEIEEQSLYPNGFGPAYDYEEEYTYEEHEYEYDDDAEYTENEHNPIGAASIDDEVILTNNQKIGALINDVFQTYGMTYDDSAAPQDLRRLLIEHPEIRRRFGSSAPYILETVIHVQEANAMAEMYDNYFPPETTPPFGTQQVTLDATTGRPVSRTFTMYDTEFTITYEGDSISLQAANQYQGNDRLTIPAPSFCYDLFSFTTIIANQQIDSHFNHTMVLFDLVPEQSVSYSSSGTYDTGPEGEPIQNEEDHAATNYLIHARPEFYVVLLTFESEGIIQKDQPYYVLSATVSGNTRNSLLQWYAHDATFYVEVSKVFPHRVMAIYH